MTCKVLRVAVLVSMMLTFSFLCRAQSTVGSVYGAITDPAGAAVANADVVITDVHTGIALTTTTNEKGEYLFSTVKPSDYTIRVTAKGFKTQTQTNVTVEANTNIHVPVTLTVGGATEVVEVQAQVTLVDTREAQVGATIDQAKVENLPTVNRDTYSLLTTVPGVSNYGGDTLTGSRYGATFSVNGLPTDTPSFYLDGAYDNSFKANGGNKAPNQDALNQFRVITSNFDAEFGRSPGAVVNMISKNGTSSYHGMMYDYNRNDAFDAKGFFNTTKATLRQNQYGATFGGPVPRLRDKLFFFTSYEHLQYHSTATVNSQQTLTALERTGDFSASTTKPKLPTSVQCGTTAAPKICASALDAVAKNLLQFIPVYANGTAQERAPYNISDDQGLARVDWQGFAGHSIYGTFFNAQGTTLDPGAGSNGAIGIPGSLPQYSGMVEYENQVNAIIADDWMLSDRTVNSVRGYYASNRYIIGNQIQGHFLSDLGSGAPEGGSVYAPPQFVVTGYFTVGPSGAGPSDIDQIAFGMVDTATLQRGRHAIKVGGSWNSSKYTEDGNQNANGIFTFNSSGTTGAALADFMLGYAYSLSQSSPVHHRVRNQDPALFGQDDWQISNRLNLNLGIRWELAQPWLGENAEQTVVKGTQSTVDTSAPLGLLFVGDKGITDGGIKTAWNRFAPRVGLAYDVFGNGRTSLRAGYGIFWQQFRQDTIGGLVQEPYLIQQTTYTTPSMVCPYGGIYTGGSCSGAVTPFPYTYTAGSKGKYYTNTALSAFRVGEKNNPYANEYNLSVQQQLTRSSAMSIAYVGSTYMKQYISMDINAPQFYPGASVNENPYNVSTANPYGVNGLNCRRPYEPYRTGGVQNSTTCQFNSTGTSGYTDAQGKPLQFGAINMMMPINNSRYNSLQVQVNGKIQKLDFNANYVWGKALNFTTPTVDQTDIRKNYGVSDIDVRQRFAFSATYHAPVLHMWGVFGRQVLSGWAVNDITILQTGAPFTVQANVDVNRDGNNNDRVNVIGDPYKHYHNHVDMVYKGYLNGSSFQQPCGATVDATCTNPYGNEQRNSLRYQPNYQTNLSVFKEFGLIREARFQFRAEAFNAFNYTNLTAVRNNLTVFPTATNAFQSADAGRRLQFAGKIIF